MSRIRAKMQQKIDWKKTNYKKCEIQLIKLANLLKKVQK